MILKKIVKNKKNMYHIIIEDFNTVLNSELDTSSKEKRIQDANLKIIRQLKNTDYIKIFRFYNPDTIKFSWSNN